MIFFQNGIRICTSNVAQLSREQQRHQRKVREVPVATAWQQLGLRGVQSPRVLPVRRPAPPLVALQVQPAHAGLVLGVAVAQRVHPDVRDRRRHHPGVVLRGLHRRRAAERVPADEIPGASADARAEGGVRAQMVVRRHHLAPAVLQLAPADGWALDVEELLRHAPEYLELAVLEHPGGGAVAVVGHADEEAVGGELDGVAGVRLGGAAEAVGEEVHRVVRVGGGERVQRGVGDCGDSPRGEVGEEEGGDLGEEGEAPEGAGVGGPGGAAGGGEGGGGGGVEDAEAQGGEGVGGEGVGEGEVAEGDGGEGAGGRGVGGDGEEAGEEEGEEEEEGLEGGEEGDGGEGGGEEAEGGEGGVEGCGGGEEGDEVEGGVGPQEGAFQCDMDGD